MKSILFLGGGKLGMPVIGWAREIGFNIIVNDKNQDAPGSALADVRIYFDSADVRSLSTWVLNHHESHGICYCWCGSDFGLLTATTIHDILNIPHSSAKAVINGLDKNLMKKCWSDDKCIHYPESSIVHSEKDAISLGQEWGWPIIIKPTSASGSQGVGLAKDRQEAASLFDEAKKYSGTGHVIAEKFIQGSHHDVNGLFWDGIFYPCGIGDRFFTPFPYCVPHHGYFPTALDETRKKDLYDLLERGARSMGITWGPVKADCVMSGNIAYVYEISPRFHGDIFTSNVMGFLGRKNPVYQLLQWIWDGKAKKFLSVEETDDRTGGWKTIFNQNEAAALSHVDGKFLKRFEDRKEVRNNDEIAGLAWSWGRSRSEINAILGVSDE
ncbi:MAG: ATP-grasp domain-containing protein [Candidatus Omnitrophota bacterium]